MVHAGAPWRRLLMRKLAGGIGTSARTSLSARLEERICYSYDASGISSLPDIVVWPRATEEVVSVVRVAQELGVPVIPRGAGTGYTGGSIPLAGGIVLSFERMNRIISVDARRLLAVVEPGCVNDDLGREVEALGLFFPPDPASLLVSTIGGNVAECAGGPRTVLYGTTRDYVVGLEMVLPDGTIARTGALARRPESGWDAGQLVVGSEGTLAILTKAALRLSLTPQATATYWVEFPSLDAAAIAVAEMTASGLPVSALELLDSGSLACATEYVRGAPPPDVPDGALLLELEGDRTQLDGAAETLSAIAEANGALTFRGAANDLEREELWKIRRAISPSLLRLASGKINEDIAVPRSAIPGFVRAMEGIAGEVGLRIVAFGHAGDGNLHVNVMVDRSDRAQMAAARRAVDRLFRAALAVGGTLSGEHGIGITKAEHLSDELDDTALDVTAGVKRAFDPRGLLNPEKILSNRPNPWWERLGS